MDPTSQPYDIPPSRLQSRVHPLGEERIKAEAEKYFEENWNFDSEKKMRGFFSIGMSKAYSLFFPLTLDDRVDMTNRMLHLSLLSDDKLEKMSLEEMTSYGNRLIQIAEGTAEPDNSIPDERVTHETLQLMRATDQKLTDDVAEAFIILVRKQIGAERLRIEHLGPYLEYREEDVGRSFFCALLRFGAAIHLSPEELQIVEGIERNAFRHVGIMNDIYSWNREFRVHQQEQSEGSLPFSAVHVLSMETKLSYPACKRLLYTYCRELELAHEDMVREIRDKSKMSQRLEQYIKGIEYFMRGVEIWSQWTPRYNFVAE
ncbi:hypothetical protein VTN00DRAFT_9664 [Thermoascus crustaceus]|uniref:uncharacterized protein n=1 Tax=Thermoascus crustaceus TaxID=5088 RepID=UPI0037431CD1